MPIMKKALSILLIISVVLPIQARETINTIPLETVSCEKQLQDCEDVLEAADRAIKAQGDLISKQSDQIQDLKFSYSIVRSQLEEVERDRSAWYRNPIIVVPLSFIAGAYLTRQVGK